MEPKLSIVQPYYNHKEIFDKLVKVLDSYSNNLKDKIEFIVVDDGSPDFPCKKPEVDFNLRVLHIIDQIEWNTAGAGNLGFYVANAPWVLHLDMDLYLTQDHAYRILRNLEKCTKNHIYFPKVNWKRVINPRNGKKFKPFHCNAFFVKKDTFWEIGGFDEDFSGHYMYADSFFHNYSSKKLNVTPQFIYTCYLTSWGIGQVPNVSRDRSHNTELYFKKINGLLSSSKKVLNFKWEEI